MEIYVALLMSLLFITPKPVACGKNWNNTSNDCSNLEPPLIESDVTEAVFTNQRYKFWERPVLNANKSIGVKLSFVIRNVAEVNERTERVKLNGFLRIYWYDEFHAWNETWPLNCIQKLMIPYGEKAGVWIPDLVFSSSGIKYELTRSPVDMVSIRSDGFAFLVAGTTFEFQCNFNLGYFPFDIQTCKLTFESWVLEMKYQHFEKPAVDVDPYHSSLSQEWELLPEASAWREEGHYQFGDFDWICFEIHLKRKPGYYALTLILPCLLIAAVEVVTFVIPFDDASRLDVSFTSLLAYSMFQSIMGNQMPHSANNPPLLLVLICTFTVYIAAAIYLQAVGILLAGKAKRGDKFPRWLLSTANFMAPIVRLPRCDGQHLTNIEAWLFIARVVDRYSAFLFIFLLVTTSFALLIGVPAAKNLLR